MARTAGARRNSAAADRRFGMGVEVAVRIYLVFECAIVRAGLESVIEDVPDVRVVGGCRDFENAAEQLQGLECDVVIADVSPPGMPLARFVERLAYFESPPRVLILPSHGRHHHIEELLRSGVRGFLDATASRDDLGSAIDAVANGRFFVSEDIAQNMMHGIATGAPQQESSLDKLSNRERQTRWGPRASRRRRSRASSACRPGRSRPTDRLRCPSSISTRPPISFVLQSERDWPRSDARPVPFAVRESNTGPGFPVGSSALPPSGLSIRNRAPARRAECAGARRAGTCARDGRVFPDSIFRLT